MDKKTIGPLFLIPIALAALCGGIYFAWFSIGPSGETGPRLPIPWDRSAVESGKAQNSGTLIPGPGKPSELPGDWPQFRGANRDNIAKVSAEFARKWPDEGPAELWRIEAGEGYAGVAVRNGRVYLHDYDRDKQEDAIRCLSLDDGAEIWRYTYSVAIKRNHGMSRTVPAVDDNFLVALGPKCHVVCLDATSGELIWKINLVEEHETIIPPWYAGQCPLIDGDRVLLAPGAKPLMMAVELATGKIVWQTVDGEGLGMTHTSIVAIEFNGVRQYVYAAIKGVVGVAADDGRLLWEHPDWRIKVANVPTPVPLGDGRIFLSGGYDAGSAMLRLSPGAEGSVEAEEIYRLKPNIFSAEQQTPIFYEDHIYGISADEQLVCLDTDGNRVWSSGVTVRFGLGPFIISKGLIFALSDKGALHLVEATPSGYVELEQAQLLDGHESWAPIAIAENRLIMRNLTEVICVDVGI